MKYKFIIVILLFVSLYWAETIDLDSAWITVQESNPQILAQKEILKSQEADVKLALYELLPSGSFTSSYNRSGENDLSNDYMSYGVSLSQPLFEGGNLVRNLDNSKLQLEQAKNQYNSLLLSLKMELEKKYYAVLEQKALLKAAEQKMDYIENNLETAQVKYDNGNLSRSELLQMQSEKAQQRVSILQIENQVRVSISDLGNFLNIDEDFELSEISIEMFREWYQMFQEIDINNLNELEVKLLDSAKEGSPSFQNSMIDISLNNNGVESAKSNFMPSLSLRLSKNWNYDFDDDPQGSMSLAINASLPLLPFGDNLQKYAKSRYSLAQTEYLLEEEELNLKLDIHTKLLNLLASVYEIEASEKALEYSKETYDQAKEQFNNNIISSNDLLNMQVSYTNSENQLTGTFYDFLENKAALKSSLGIYEDSEFWQLLFD